MLIHIKHPIEESFDDWCNNFPESFHPLDMKRFYIFVKCTCKFGRGKNYEMWLRKKLEKSKMSIENIDYFCNLFGILVNFHKTYIFPLYEDK